MGRCAASREKRVLASLGKGTVDIKVPDGAGRRREEHVGEIIARRAGRSTADGTVDDGLTAGEVRGEIEVVDAQVDEHAVVGRSRRADALEVDGDDRLVADEPRQRPDHRVESLGVADEEAPRSP
jgi:hypothetical protein